METLSASRIVASRLLSKFDEREIYERAPHLLERLIDGEMLSLDDLVFIANKFYGGRVTRVVGCLDPKRQRAEDTKPVAPAETYFMDIFIQYLKDKWVGVEWDSKKDVVSWQRDIRWLVGHNPKEELENVIRWVFADKFWSTVITTPGKLKKHYDDLLLKTLNQTPQQKALPADADYRPQF